MIRIERVYSPPVRHGRKEFRILVDRLWPRGIRKENAGVDLWLKDIAPSDGLRKWFAHDPGRWDGFRKKYFSELDGMPETVNIIKQKTKQADVVLVYGAKDELHNNAVALVDYLETHGE